MTRETEDQSQVSTPQETERQDRYHLVQPGENLTAIAQAYYGPEHAAHWITLYNYNRELIGENPDIIQSGMELLIPDISEFL